MHLPGKVPDVQTEPPRWNQPRGEEVLHLEGLSHCAIFSLPPCFLSSPSPLSLSCCSCLGNVLHLVQGVFYMDLCGIASQRFSHSGKDMQAPL